MNARTGRWASLVALVATALVALTLAGPTGARVRLVSVTSGVSPGSDATLTAAVSPARPSAALAAPARSLIQPLHGQTADCRPGYYRNVSGHCVRRPSNDPA